MLAFNWRAQRSDVRFPLPSSFASVCLALLLAVLLGAGSMPASTAAPDPVLEWIAIMNTTVITGGTSPLVTARVVALVSASVFDSVNGIDRRYKPLHVTQDAPPHASQRAAAIQSAYAMLIKLYPAQIGSLTSQRDASIAAITSSESAQSILLSARPMGSRRRLHRSSES